MSANYNSNNNRKRPKVRGNFQRSYDQKEMTYEEERRKTFKAWSKTCQVKPNSLAKAGFFYVGIFDRVKCFSCGGQIEGWEEGDTAMGEHKKMYPHCHMVKNQDKRNVTIEKWNEMQKGQSTEEVDGEIVWGKHKTLTSDECVDAFCETSYERLSSAFKPLFGGELDRLETFRDNWSEEFKLPSSETRWLANAGFYYTGPGDRATCFYCNACIECWEEDDEAWSEHARYSPKCEWLIEMIGKVFVAEVQDFFKNAKASEQAEKREPKQNPAVSTQSSPSGRQKTSASVAVSAHMDSPTVQTIVKAGYDQALVRRVLEAQLHVRETGLNFSFSDNFIKTLDAAEKGKNSTDEKPVEYSASTIEPQTQQFANLEIKGVPRREESPTTKSDHKSFVTAKFPGHKQVSSTASSPGYLPDVGPKKVLCKVSCITEDNLLMSQASRQYKISNMRKQPGKDTIQHEESGYESVGKREMLWALESIHSAIKDGSITTSDYHFKFTSAKYNKQAGSCNRRSRRSPFYEPEFSVQMLVAVKTAFEDVENGFLKEGGYYFELSTPHFQFTSGCYPRQEKDVNTCADDKQEPILCSPDNKSLVESLFDMIQVIVVLETVRMLLLASPVAAFPIIGEEKPLTLTAGENGIIPFACRNEQQSASTYYTVKFEEKDRPFYIDGTFDSEGLMSPDQAERFRVEYFEEGSSMSVEINIASVSVEDQGTYIVLLMIQGVKPKYHLMKRVVLIFIPPGPAVCFLMPSEVHCHSKPGNGNSTLTCFQNGDKILYRKKPGDTQVVYRRIFYHMNTNIPVFCCSHDIKEMDTITQTSCDQYRYPRIELANSPISPGIKIHVPTKMVRTTKPLSVEGEKKQPSTESTSSYSGCDRNVDWPAVMLPVMAFFTYMCMSNP